jgi:quercetin dioxygenase-like cupin family protein
MDKASESFNFLLHKKYDISKIQKYILKYSSEWDIDTSRQQFPTHRETKSVFLYKTALSWDGQSPYKVNELFDSSELKGLVDPIIFDFQKIHNGVVGQALLVRLPSGKSIPEHSDSGYYLLNSRRHHLPIYSEGLTEFTVNGETVKMQEGECWEINNAKIHSVKNKGSQDRIHLIFDIVPNYVIEKSNK